MLKLPSHHHEQAELFDKQACKSICKNMKVIFRPWWNDNPYQRLLAEHLEHLSIDVKKAGSQTHLPLQGGRPDVIHLHWLHPFFLFPNPIDRLNHITKFIAGLIVLKLMGTKIVWTAHNLNDHNRRYPLADRICTSFVILIADRIIAHSETAKLELVQAFSVSNKSKVSVVPHANYIGYYENKISKAEARRQLKLPDSSLTLLFLGSIRPYKGVLKLIETFKQQQHSDLHLVIAGKPSDDATTATIEQATANTPNIKFVPGFVPDTQIQIYMNACDAVMFPYQDILTSGAVLLAMSFGRACVAPRLGSIVETLDSSGAFLYDPSDEMGLSQAVSQIIENQVELSSMGAHNLQVAKQWSWNSIAEMTRNVYRSCL